LLTSSSKSKAPKSSNGTRLGDSESTQLDNGRANNSPHGTRGDFRKITVTLPPEAYEQLISEAARRKIAAEPNHLLSALVREALVNYLETIAHRRRK
jgi:hypothetical protein